MDGLAINAVDIGVLIILLASALLALLRGFFAEVLLIASLVGAFFATLYGDQAVRPFFDAQIENDLIATGATWGAIFVPTFILLSVLNHFLAQALKVSSLSAADRSLGVLFGLLRGAAIVSLAYLVLVSFADREKVDGWMDNAATQPFLESGAKLLLRLVPEHKRWNIEGWTAAAQQRASEEITRRTFETLVAPPVNSDASRTAGGYTDQQRREMDRAVDASR